MKKIARVLDLLAVTLVLLIPQSAHATAASDGFCFKRGDYYDEKGQGWHVLECYNESGDGWVIDFYWIKHGTTFYVTYQY